ncbi:hypothetical protein LTR37_014213 [Vermiconidia calcicola]|uniref:Uncharacterized protein n=1 Tax=Vermiconidia calcicola TaxID=1690605 RepID=A0ACC3MU02_9PEZI|nr:hypothetical protein LTR37_014213 [Vermiconidia calcicola]
MDYAQNEREIEALVDQIFWRNASAWAEKTPSQRADLSQNAIRGHLHYDHDQEADVERLCVAIAACWPSLDAGPEEHREANFRKWVVGDDARQSRAKIFATTLYGDLRQHLPQVWTCLFSQFRKYLAGDPDPQFCDGCLPLSDDHLQRLFGHEIYQTFSDMQHEFCPVDPSEIEIDSEVVAEELRKIIEERTICCETISEEGKTDTEPEDTWCSRASLQDAFTNHEKLLKSLDNVRQKADAFLEIVKTCPRTLATFLFTIPAKSGLWTRLIDSAAKDGKPFLFPTGTLSDDSLPLEWRKVSECVDERYQDEFYAKQLRFSPVDFHKGDHFTDAVRWLGHRSRSPCLPLYRKSFFDRGGYGKVWRVKVDGDYIDTKTATTGDLAMKVIPTTYGLSHPLREWEIAQKIHADAVYSSGLLVPFAMLRTDSNIHYFMPLADCNLLALMSCKDRRRRHPGQNVYAEDDIAVQEERYRSEVPRNHKDRKDRLGWMRNPAEGLRRLHHGFRSEEGQGGKVVHGDVKNTNILYTYAEGQPFLCLADFGICAFKYQAKSSSNGTSDEHASGLGTRVRLNSLCPNYPPEAEKNHMVDQSADLWGFGTFFAEFVAWMSGGPTALSDYERARDTADRDRYNGLSYRRVRDDVPLLKEEITSWFESLIEKTTHPKDKRLYRNCWRLLKHGLLVCDPSRRIEVDKLCTALGYILDGDSQKLAKLLLDHGDGQVSNPPTDDTAGDPSAPRETVATPRSPVPQNREPGRSRPPHIQAPLAPTTSATADDPVQFAEMRDPADHEFLRALRDERDAAASELIRQDMVFGTMDEDLNTPLHYAVRCPTTVVTKKLLEMYPECWRAQNDEGQTALHICARINHQERACEHAKLLMRHNMAILEVMDRYQKTALNIASEKPRTLQRQQLMILLRPSR